MTRAQYVNVRSLIKKLMAKLSRASKPVVMPSAPVKEKPTVVYPRVEWGGQKLFAGVNYRWSGQASDEFCEMVKSLGFTGIHCELMEAIITGDLRQQQSLQINKLKHVADSCRKHGLDLMISNNSNDKLNANGGMTIDIMRERLEQIKSVVGTDNVLLQPMSEDGGNTDPKVRALARGWAVNNWPAEQIAHYGVEVASGYSEQHSSIQALMRSGPRTLFVTDNSSQRVEQLTSSAYVTLAKKHIDAGNSFAVYGFHAAPDFEAWKEIGSYFRSRKSVLPAPQPPLVDEAIPVEIMSAQGFSEGRKLPSIGSMKVSARLESARTDGRVVYFEPVNPLGEGAWICGAWREGDKWYWSDMEGLHKTNSSKNYADNLFPVPSKGLSGRCRENGFGAHYPRKGEPLYVFIANNSKTERTNIVFAGLQT